MWLQWLMREDVSSTEKCKELHKLDKRGWSALHYAARHYCVDILSAALGVQGGEWKDERCLHKSEVHIKVSL